jgi:hypothetical protein
LAWYPHLRRCCPVTFANAFAGVVRVLDGPLPLPAARTGAARLGRGRRENLPPVATSRITVSEPAQVLECIDEDNERSVQSLVSSDTRMGDAMKRFLLRCLDRSPNTRPAAIDLMSDPWLTGVDQQVRTPIPSQSPPCSARSFLDLRVYETFYNHPTCAPRCPSSSLALAPATLPAMDEQCRSKVYAAAEA